MTARQDNTAAQLVAGHVKPLDKSAQVESPDRGRGPVLQSLGGDTSLDREAIAAEAYALWAARGYQDGSDIEDWLEAERRLRDAAGLNGDATGIR
jgi:hypothetical protein